MKEIFNINNNTEDNVQQLLLITVGEKHVAVAISNKQGSELYRLAYCTENEWTDETLQSFFDAYPFLNNDFYQVLIAYGFSGSVLVPSGNYRKEGGDLLLSVLCGIKQSSSVVSEAVPEWQLYNVYELPDSIHNRFRKKFPRATFRHSQSLTLRSSNPAKAENCLLVDFRSEDFSVLALKLGQLLLANTFEYAAPADVVFHLLKICQNFDLSQQAVLIQLSGLIDKDSALYKELSLYFIHIEFREAIWNGSAEYPAHFFTTLNDLAQCAL